MRKSYITEHLILICSGIAGVLISTLGWVGFIGAVIILFLTSYFLVSKLKEHTIKEYLKEKKKEKGKK